MYKFGCFWKQITEKPTQKGNLSYVGISLGVGGFQAPHVQAPVYFFEFPLVLSSFSLRLIVLSENVTVSGGRKGATHLWPL